MTKKRLFIAFPVSQEVENELRLVQDKMRSLNLNARVKWVGDEGFHATVVFLGDVEIEKIDKIKGIIRQVAGRYKKFEFYLDKIDAFPNQREPRVIVVKISRGEWSFVHKLHEDLINELQKIGLEIENRHWTSHLTLGRVKEFVGTVGTGRDLSIDISVSIQNISWQVYKIELIESELLPSGPKYTVLESFKLKNL